MIVRCVIVALVVGACRGGPTAVRYSGPPVGECAAGRAYMAPALGTPTQAFIPIAEAAPPAARPETHDQPAAPDEPAATESADAEDEPAKPAKPAKGKTKKRGKKSKKSEPKETP